MTSIVLMFGQICKKIRFPNEEADQKGFRILRRSGYAFDMFKGNIYGITSETQTALLDEKKIPYEIVE